MYNENNNQNVNSFNYQNTEKIPNNVQNINSNKSNLKNKKNIIIIVIIIIICLFLFLKCSGNLSGSNGYTADYGQTLKINELNGTYKFDINVISIEKNHYINNLFYNGEYPALKVTIKNNSDESLSLLLVKFKLLDSSNNVIGDVNSFVAYNVEGAINDEIPSGQTATGNLYFDNPSGTDDNLSEVDTSDISKLEIGVIKEDDYQNGRYTATYEQYYINLK